MRYDAQFQVPNTRNLLTLLESGDGGNVQPQINYHTLDTLPTAKCKPFQGSEASSGACAVCQCPAQILRAESPRRLRVTHHDKAS